MNELNIFESPVFGQVRTVTLDGEPWFVGKDVAAALGYGEGKSLANAVANHVDDEDKGVTELMTPGGKQKMVIINESGLYSLVLSSKLPTAKDFKRWVTSEILPSIRRHGAYLTPETLQEAILNPDTMIQLCQQLKEEQSRNRQLTAENAALTVEKTILQPKADYFDDLVDRNLLVNFTEAAKQLGVKRKTLITFMTDHGYLYRDKKGNLLPYANKKAEGLFEVKESSNQKTGWAGCQTLLTPRGVETFRLLCQGM